ncbi:MAG: response regulator, partial [Alphaproteobacteria bacterium]|nr:response regulator [Alphaproteobacteria bacterium]
LRPGGPPVRLLIVDDHPPNRTYLTRLLQGAGFVTVEAADGAEALRLAAELRPDAVLMDIVMPVMDGLEATRRIRALPEGGAIRVIAVSASVFEEDRGLVLAAGADDFLRKPIRDSDLLESIGRQLELDWERAAIDHAALGRLPPDLARRLRDAARAFQLTESRAILDEMAALEPGLARDLRAVLDEFDWDGLSAALGPVEANP